MANRLKAESMLRRIATGIIMGVFIGAAVLPLGALVAGALPAEPISYVVVALGFIGWGAALALYLARRDLRTTVTALATRFGIESRFKSFETVAHSLLKEMERKNSAFLTNIVERRIASKEELSRVLERIVAQAYRLLQAESAELALFDKESGLYHSSFVLGKPFRSSAQAMLAGAIDQAAVERDLSSDVLVQPVAFGGSVLGSLRVALQKGAVPSTGDREVMHLLAIQGGLAIINAQYHEELFRMKRAGEESVKVKTGFLANLSHELRGPLGLMINAVELVLDGLCGPVSADQLDTLKMVRSNGEHLLELINDVLDYAKVESGKIVADATEILVPELLKDIAGVVRAQAEAKRHTVSYRAGGEALTVRSDRRHMRQILINLLTNAIKYTPEGGTIELWAERCPGGKIKINVTDTGVGIEEADRPKVFAPFERVDNAYSVNQVGTGLGLSLTKRLVEVNAGTIDFSSTPGKGSHFWIILPAAEFTPEAREQEATPRAVEGHGERILLVETNREERAVIERYLAHLGFRVSASATKLGALQVLREQQVDLVVVDNASIDHTGDLFPQEIRESAQVARVPILLLTSRAFIFDIEKYLKAGVDRCLSKPVGLGQLAQTCRALLDGKSGDEGTGQKTSASRGVRDRSSLVH
jgi:signal transduction histidine kinase/CheY-like chemotaxis protein